MEGRRELRDRGLVHVHARPAVFEQHRLPAGPSFAFAAAGDREIVLLTGRRDALRTLLTRERPPGAEQSEAFARTIGEALLHEGARGARVVRSVEELLSLPGHEPTAELLEAELRRRVRPPRVVRGDAGFRESAGYRFEGWFVTGTHLDRRRLVRVEIQVGARSAEIAEEVVLDPAFARVPFVRI